MYTFFSGPTECGKSTFVFKLLKHRNQLFTSEFESIYYCLPPEASHRTTTFVESLRKMIPNIVIIFGLPEPRQVLEHPLPKLFVIDDQAKKNTKPNFKKT